MFLTCYEEIARAMLEETSVRRLKYHLPENVYPKHFRVKSDDLNKESGYTLLPGMDKGRRVKVYILDEGYRKKPYGAWGPLYVMDYAPAHIEEVIENPYGPGTLYGTGDIARILPNGTVDFLEVNGKEVVTDGVKGRKFIDLNVTRQALSAYPGIEKADAYLKYNAESNEFNLYADVILKQGQDGFDQEACMAYLKENCPEINVPLGLTVTR